MATSLHHHHRHLWILGSDATYPVDHRAPRLQLTHPPLETEQSDNPDRQTWPAIDQSIDRVPAIAQPAIGLTEAASALCIPDRDDAISRHRARMETALQELTNADEELIRAAREVIDANTDAPDVEAAGVHAMGAAVRDSEGRIHVGINPPTSRADRARNLSLWERPTPAEHGRSKRSSQSGITAEVWLARAAAIGRSCSTTFPASAYFYQQHRVFVSPPSRH